jgi:flagellar hook-associated protein 3 FlgL
MIRSVDSNNEAFLVALSRTADRMQRAERQVASGKRVSAPSDDPEAVATIVQLRSSLARLDQTSQNLGRAKSETDAAEQTLQTAAKLMDRASTLAAQGVNGTQTAESRQAIATEVASLMEQMVGLSRTTVEGRYIFSGDSDQTAPYTLDWTAVPPLSGYTGSPATRQIEHPNGNRMSLSRTAQQVFDGSGAASVFGALDALRTSLLANDVPGISQAIGLVGASSSYLNAQLASCGSAQNQVADAIDYAAKSQTQVETQLSALEEADVADAIVELQQAQTQQQAALLVRSNVLRTSLFDFFG